MCFFLRCMVLPCACVWFLFFCFCFPYFTFFGNVLFRNEVAMSRLKCCKHTKLTSRFERRKNVKAFQNKSYRSSVLPLQRHWKCCSCVAYKAYACLTFSFVCHRPIRFDLANRRPTRDDDGYAFFLNSINITIFFLSGHFLVILADWA